MHYATDKMERTTTTAQEQPRQPEAVKAKAEPKKKVVAARRSSNRWFFSFNGWSGTDSNLYDDFVLA